MDIQGIHIAFYQELDKTQDFEYPSFQPEQIDYWLNKGQLELVQELAYPLDSRFPGFDNGQKRVDELRDITKPSGALIPSQIGSKYEVTLPEDYFHLVRHQCTTLDPDCGDAVRTVGGTQTKLDFINIQLKDPFWTPTAEEPLYYILGDKLVYETKDNFVLQSVNIDYIKYPNKMQFGSAYALPTSDIQCEFTNEDMQHRIINKAVSMVLENIESRRYQTNLNELTEK